MPGASPVMMASLNGPADENGNGVGVVPVTEE